MLKQNRIILIALGTIFLSSFFCAPIFAQAPKSFSADSVQFLSEMSDYFSSVKGKEKEGKEFIKEQFKPFWFGGHLSDEKRKFVYATSMAMLQKKLRPYPDYFNFFSALINLYTKAKLQENSIKSWQMSLEKLISKSSAKKLSDFLEASNDIFGMNKLYQSPSVEWFTGTNNFEFSFDSLPKIIFEKTDLFCAVKADTASIIGTSGIYYPTEKKWVGKGGKVTWKRAGIEESSVNAELKKYSANVTKSGYEADSVVFINKFYFQNPLLGTLDEKAVPDATVENATYPRFESYSTHFEIKNLADGKVDFEGGFSIRGSKFIGSGSTTADAVLYFKWKGKPLVKASSKTFIFKKEKITSEDAAIVMYLDKDSIFHPSIKMKFEFNTKELSLIRPLEGISKTPYFNTYHKVDMRVEEINWKLDSAKMDFKTLIGSSIGVADFSSSSYFRSNLFTELQGYDDINPLTALKQCAEKLGKTSFTAVEFSELYSTFLTRTSCCPWS